MRDWSLLFRRMMPVIDWALVLISFRLGYYLRYDLQILKPVDESIFAAAAFEAFLPYALLYAFWLVGTRPVAGLYRGQLARCWFDKAQRYINGACNATDCATTLNWLLR